MKIKYYFDKYYSHGKKLGYLFNNHSITKVTSNSKEVSKNAIYCHFKENECLNYIDEAINLGAKTIITSHSCSYKTKKNVNIIQVDNPKVEIARINKELYLEKYNVFPNMISITGTTGKTTVSTLIFKVLKSLNKDVLLISSNKIHCYFGSNYDVYDNKNTTPSNDIIYQYMMEHELPYDFVIIEVSSQGIVDLRVLGMEFDYTLVTNFNPEHQEYHKNELDYLNAKLKLIPWTKKHLIINQNIKHFNKFISSSELPYTTYGIESGDFKGSIIKCDLEESLFYLQTLNKKYLVKSKLIGDFNVLNLVSVITLLNVMGFSILKVIEIIEQIDEIDGRMNMFTYQDRHIIVDYAHSKIALEYLVSFLKQVVKKRLIVVIGAGGLRDVTYRSFIGKLICEHANYVIFTEDNSRDELTQDIISDIIKEVKSNNYEVVYIRQQAIDKAIQISQTDDIIVIIGKGNEDFIISKKITKFNDVKYIKSLVNKDYE